MKHISDKFAKGIRMKLADQNIYYSRWKIILDMAGWSGVIIFGMFIATFKNAAAVVPVVLLCAFQVMNDWRRLSDRSAKIMITADKLETKDHHISWDQIRSVEISWDIASRLGSLVFPRVLNIGIKGRSKPVRIDVHRFYSKRAVQIKAMIQSHLESKT